MHGERNPRRHNTDIYAEMYITPEATERYAVDPNSKAAHPLRVCTSLGNSCGVMKDYWDLARKYPKYRGGFIWDFGDQDCAARMPRQHDIHLRRRL